MDIKYDAFISYRHAEVDSAVAREVQHQLERYTIPKSLQKKLGKKKIERVFRDKEELPITADLNDDIGSALRNSDFLIVICSPRTSQSQWVLKEIETFLRHHDKSHVLTVLAEGDPYEVIPEMLRTDTVVTEDGTEIQREIEPLSCDYRMPFKQAKKAELPRLVAVILGCGYDELVQRQRQYRQRQLATVFGAVMAVTLGFLAYVINSNIKIKANYEQALRNQSIYLATESQKALENKDRFLALDLAIRALPQEGEDRPLIPQAVHALAEAENLYNVTDSVLAVATFTTVDNIQGIKYNEEHDRLIAWDKLDNLYQWDTDTYQLISKTNVPDLRDCDGKYYWTIVDSENLGVYDVITGQQLWSENINYITYSRASDGIICYHVNSKAIVVRDLRTGELILETGEYEDIDLFIEKIISPTKILFRESGLNQHGVFCLDVPTGEMYKLRDDIQLVEGAWANDDRIFMLTVAGDDGMKNMIIGGQELSTEQSETLMCFDAHTMQPVRRTKIYYYQSETYSEMYENDDGTWTLMTTNIVCKVDNDGNILSRVQTRSPIVASYKASNGNIALVTTDGYFASYTHDDNTLFTTKILSAGYGLIAPSPKGLYIKQSNDTIVKYTSDSDDSYNIIAEGKLDYLHYSEYGDRYLIMVDASCKMRCVDLLENKLMWDITLENAGNPYSKTFLGLSEDESKFYVLEAPDLYIYDVQTGDFTTQAVDIGFLDEKKVEIYKDKLYKADRFNEDSYIQDLNTGEKEPFDISVGGPFHVLLDDKLLYYRCYKEGFIGLYDLATGEEKSAELETGYHTVVNSSNNGKYLIVTCDKLATVLDWQLNIVRQYEAEDEIVALLYDEDSGRIYLLLQNGMLYVYNADGTFVGAVRASKDTYIMAEDCYMEKVGNEIYICNGSAMCVMDAQELCVIHQISICKKYYQPTNQYLLESHGQVVGYDKLSVEQMIERGHEMLGAYEMSDKLKSQYGIQ